MQLLADEAVADLPRVTAVWGSRWAQRVVAACAVDAARPSKVVDDYGDLDHIAAVATAEVQTHPGRPDPVGDRVGINPDNWPKLPRSDGASFSRTSSRTWRRVLLPARPCRPGSPRASPTTSAISAAASRPTSPPKLAADVRAGHVPTELPADNEFDGDSKRLSQAYEGAWLACRLIAERHGQSTLVRFYRAVGTSSSGQSDALSTASTKVLHEPFARFTRDWRSFLQAQLA